MSPLRLWDLALRKYRVLQRLEQQYNDAQITQDAKLRAEAEVFAQAAHALRKLQTAEAAKKLEEYQRWADAHGETIQPAAQHLCSQLVGVLLHGAFLSRGLPRTQISGSTELDAHALATT